jgi:hypothetical protein
MLVCNLSHSVGQNHFFCKYVFYQVFRYSEVSPENSTQFASQKFRFPASRPDDVSSRPDAQLSNASTVRTTCQTVRTPIRLKHHTSERRGFPSGPSSMSRRFELLKLASVRTTFSVRSILGISFQNTITRRLMQPSERRGFPSGRAHPLGKYRNSNSDVRMPISMVRTRVHQISHPDYHPPGPDAQSLYMEIICSERATVRMTGHHCPYAALKQERSSAKFLKFRSHSCLSKRPMTTVRTVPSFIKLDAHLNCQPINRGSYA